MDVKHVESQTTRQAQDNSQLKIPTSTDPCLPPHMVLEKGPNLREVAKEMAGRTEELDEEFKLIVDAVRVNSKKESTIGRLEKNKLHNRYTDIGKYSNDNMSLSSLILSPLR